MVSFQTQVSGEPFGRTKGWNAKIEKNGLALKDETRLRCMYNILSSIQIMIRNPGVLDSMALPTVWTTFHEKALWLGVRFPLYPFIRKFLILIQLLSRQLMPNGWRYLLCLTVICRKLGLELEMSEFNDTYVLKQTLQILDKSICQQNRIKYKCDPFKKWEKLKITFLMFLVGGRQLKAIKG